MVGIGNGARWMRSVRRPDEYFDLLDRSAADRASRALTGQSEFVERNDILLPDRQSAELAAAARRLVPGAIGKIPLEYVDDTLGFNPEWVVDKIAPRPVLFITTDNDRLVPPEESQSLYARAGEPKKLVMLKGFGHYEVYAGEALRQVMDATLAWYREHLPASRRPRPSSGIRRRPTAGGRKTARRSRCADPRLNAYRPDLADARLRGLVAAPRYTEGKEARIVAGRAKLRRAPVARRPNSTHFCHYGEPLLVFDEADGFVWCQSQFDRYVGYVEAAACRARRRPAADPLCRDPRLLRLRQRRICARRRAISCRATPPSRSPRPACHPRHRIRPARHRPLPAARLPVAGAAALAGYRRRRRALSRLPLSVGRQELSRDRLLRPRAERVPRHRP